MVKVSVEVRNGAARFVVAVRAESIGQAVSLVGSRYSGGVRVKFPIGREGSFVKNPAAQARVAVFEQPDGMAA